MLLAKLSDSNKYMSKTVLLSAYWDYEIKLNKKYDKVNNKVF